MSVSFCLPHPVAVSAFMICRGLCACTEMCVLYVSFGSKVRPRTLQDVPHLFDCTGHPNDLSPVNLWDKPVKTIQEMSFLDLD